MGMDNTEILSILLDADERWGKFSRRDDRLDQLTNIVGLARLKRPEKLNTGDYDLPLMGLRSFLSLDMPVRWVIPGLVPESSLTCLVSRSGVGKTQLSLQLAMHLALGRSYLGFKIDQPRKIAFLSLEMAAPNLHQFLETMTYGYSTEDLATLEENLAIIPYGHGLYLDKNKDQLRVLTALEAYAPEGIFIDSLTTSIGESSNSDEAINYSVNFYKREFIVKRSMFVWVIHHFRKSQVGNKKPRELDDLRGSGTIGQHADLVLSLWSEASGDICLSSLKTRMSVELPEIHIRRTDSLSFERVDGDADDFNGDNWAGRSPNSNEDGPEIAF